MCHSSPGWEWGLEVTLNPTCPQGCDSSPNTMLRGESVSASWIVNKAGTAKRWIHYSNMKQREKKCPPQSNTAVTIQKKYKWWQWTKFLITYFDADCVEQHHFKHDKWEKLESSLLTLHIFFKITPSACLLCVEISSPKLIITNPMYILVLYTSDMPAYGYLNKLFVYATHFMGPHYQQTTNWYCE